MNETKEALEILNSSLEKAVEFLKSKVNESNSVIHIYTHLDADGLSAGAILGKTFFRENIPFQIRVLKQLERERIIEISKEVNESGCFVIFADFGSGQYLDLMNYFTINETLKPFLIIDHHLPQNIADKDDPEISKIHKDTNPWHLNPYFFGIDGSLEISGAGMCYLFSKTLNKNNVDLSPIALIGATGDIQNQGPNHSFSGINSQILEDALGADLLEIMDDLNFSPIKPLNDAIAYSKKIKLPGLTGNSSTSLLFLKKLGIIVENPDGTIRTLNNLDQNEKQVITSAIIEYGLKYEIDPEDILPNLIINRYILKNEVVGSELYELNEFSNILNACGRSENGSLGIAIAMGDRRIAYHQAKKKLKEYRKIIMKAMNWIHEGNRITKMNHIQYFFGQDMIPDTMIGTIASMLVFDESDVIDKDKPIFGCAKREQDGVYKISARAPKELVSKGVNLSEAIRSALEKSDLDVLGGGHPPAAGTKVPIEDINNFLKKCDFEIKSQIEGT